jgi:Flp pilus assembly pilin Flp
MWQPLVPTGYQPALWRRNFQMLSLIKRLFYDEDGATTTEYAMLVVFVALAIAVGAQAFGTSLSGFFSNVASSISGLPTTIPGS